MATEPFDPHQYLRKIRTKQGMVDYLDVKFRVLWLRAEHPDASIVTEAVYANNVEACMKATISYTIGDRVVLACGHGSETHQNFPSGHIEKAETKAIGRACAVLGYGTDSAADFDDGEPLDGRAAAKDERAARRADGPEATPPAPTPIRPEPKAPEPSRLPATRRAGRQAAQGQDGPPEEGHSNVHQHMQVAALAEHGFDVAAALSRIGVAKVEDLTRDQAKGLIIEGRSSVRAGHAAQ